MHDDQHVYIVDDDAEVCASAQFFLPTVGYNAQAFTSGADFLAALPTLPSGCVLLDLRMPGIDGFHIITALAPRRRRFPIIVITGHGDVVTAVRAMKMGALDFVEKPFEEAALLVMLARVFDTLEHDSDGEASRSAAVARLNRLTGREADVLRGLMSGQSNKLLAHELGVSIRTIEMHRSRMMDRLGVSTLADALHLAFEAGTLPEPTATQQ